MKEIEYYIESNKKLLQDRISQRNNTTNESDRKRLTHNIIELDSYIKGLEDAKKYIENEVK